jgi:hypothetical protein
MYWLTIDRRFKVDKIYWIVARYDGYVIIRVHFQIREWKGY